jgi:hypothetical protein
MRVHVPAVVVLAVLLAAPTSAIIIRHDRADALYVQLAESLAGLCHLNLQVGSGPPDGEGVLIDPCWVLTAAHVAVEIRPGHGLTVVGHGITADVAADEVFVHPEREQGPHDIALVRLERPVTELDPVPIYRRQDEAGMPILIGGRGDFGTGETGPTTNDGQLRAATNRVDEAMGQFLVFRFDGPDRATELEGISGPGDSGGPAFFIDGDEKSVVGISSGQDTEETGGREGVYGVVEYYARVSFYLDWIDGVLGGEAPQGR